MPARGITLVALLVALALGALVALAAGSLHALARAAHGLHESSARVHESGNLLLELLARHAYLAGFADLTPTASSTRPFDQRFGVPAVLGCARGSLTDLAATTPAACSTDVAGNDSLLLRYQALPDPSDPAATLPGYDALRSLGGDCLGQSPAASGALLATSHFRVAAGALGCVGNGNPGRSQPLVQGVEEFRLRYLVDVDGDGSADSWLAAGESVLASAAGWTRVRAVSVCVRLRSDDPATRGTQQTVPTCDGTPRSVSDGRVRRTFRTVLSLPNQLPGSTMVREGALP